MFLARILKAGQSIEIMSNSERYLKPCAYTFIILLVGCNSGPDNRSNNAGSNSKDNKLPLFSLVSHAESGVDFSNELAENDRVNPFIYINAFGGGGVAIGDINNDGLQDIYFTANTKPNRLFLNLGDMKFKDITGTAGVSGGEGWCSGISMADVNGDGLLDIYVCKEFNFKEDSLRQNILYINNGDLTFTNRAAEYGVADAGLSVQSTFFDYDLDGDLDLYVGNHPWVYTLDFDHSLKQIKNPESRDTDRLYRNDGTKFTDVTKAAGMINFGFTLGLVAGDFDKDGWPDLYVANDHTEPDLFYRNNGNGTFTNVVSTAMKHTANFAMGVDMADVNNDGWLDLINVDMLAKDNFRQKTQMSGMAPKEFWRNVDAGYHYQYMRNMLQINNGNGTFSEIGQLAGVSKTDWSWAALFADFNNDGNKDLYVTNGYRLDARDNDFLKSRQKENEVRLKNKQPLMTKEEFGAQIREKLSATKLSNFYFESNGDYTFTSKANEYGLGLPGFSNGAAYGDLDNDGDLDLVVNNLDEISHIYQNNTTENGGNSIRIKLVGEGKNKFGLGAKVEIQVGETVQYQEHTATRGYLSSVENVLHFGLAQLTEVNEIRITWPDGRYQKLSSVKVGQELSVFQKDASAKAPATRIEKPMFSDLTRESGIGFKHVENDYDDYKKESLLPHKMSQFGPCLATGDVNGDGFDDFYVGGALGQAGMMYLGLADAKFTAVAGGPWEIDRGSEDLGAVFFDADNDGDLDLYVASGGNEFFQDAPALQDRLYLNQGNGKFSKGVENLPKLRGSGSCVVSGDFDGDGDLDLFVGGRVVPGAYPFPARSFLLQNNAGIFSDVTASLAPDLFQPGLVTSAVWTDFDGDKQLDLVVVGEWMPITFYKNSGGKLASINKDNGMENTSGWWNRIIAADFDGDRNGYEVCLLTWAISMMESATP